MARATPRICARWRSRCRARSFAARPQLAIYLAGADPFEGDRLGKLALSKAGLAARDRFVLLAMREAGIGVAIAMAGGYADNLDDIVDIHFSTVLTALALHAPAADDTPSPASSDRTRSPTRR